MKRKSRSSLFLVCCAIALIVACYFSNVFEITGLSAPTCGRVERKFQNNKNDLYRVCDYFEDINISESDSARIDITDSAEKLKIIKYDSNSSSYVPHEQNITNRKLSESINNLKNAGYYVILREYNYVCFGVWSSFDSDVCLIYSPYGEPEITNVNCEKQVVKKLKTSGWYYVYTVS